MTRLAMVVVFVVGAAFLTQSCARSEKSVSRFESVVLNEDWPTIIKMAGDDRALDPTVASFLKAHGLLALNKNNDSLCAFADLRQPSAAVIWEAWARSLSARHPKNAGGHYLHGDALARIGSWAAAVAEFDRALSLNQKHFLALNARGVVHTIQGRYDAGLLDFVSATAANPGFADADTNRGFLYVRRRGSGLSELKAFDAALASNPRVSLAIIGKGQALVATGRAIAGLSEIDNALRPCACLRALADGDRAELFSWVRTRDSVTMARASNEDAGTTLTTLLKDLAQNRDTASAKKVIDFVASTDNPDLQKKATMTFQSMEKTDKEMGGIIGRAINEKKIENETLHGDLLKQSSEKVSTEAQVGLEYKKDGVTIGGSTKASASGDLGAFANQQLKDLNKKEAYTQQLDSQVKSGKEQSGGAETVLIGLARIEQGDAPRFYHDGLLYAAGVEKGTVR